MRKTIKGSTFLTGSEAINQVCSMLRNIILARYLTKADFGVAALLALILSLFEMTGKMAFGQQLIQSKHGDDPAYLDSVHFTQVVLGLVSTLLVFACAWPLAQFVAGPEYLGSFFLLGLVPLINGFNHLEVFRRTRNQNYGALVLVEMIPQILTTIAAWPLAVLLKDYRAVLWLLLGRSILSIAIAHLFAERRFQPRYDRIWLKQSLEFGWPLLLAGFVQMGSFQGDSMVVAAGYTLSQLGEYSVAMTMAMAPGIALLRVSHSVMLPLLSEVQGDFTKLVERYSRYVEIVTLLSSLATLGMLFCGENVIVLLYGTKYEGVGALACLLTAAQGIRVIRGATVGVAMARGDTVNNLIANLWRLSGLVLAIFVGWMHGSLMWFALTGFTGEIVALTISVRRLSRHHSLMPMLTFKPALIGIACLVAAAAFHVALDMPVSSWWNWLFLGIAASITVVVFNICFPQLRSLSASLFLKVNERLGMPLPRSWWEIKRVS